MVREEAKQAPEDSQQPNKAETSQNVDNLFSPRFKSVAAMAGWDEEALIIASLVVEDTPDRQQSKQKKRSASIFNTPPCTSSRRKRRAQRTPFNLDEEQEVPKEESEKESMEQRIVVEDEKNPKANEPALHCMDKLREELSCAICLDICFEPSTTPCGHSFCKKCLRSAADKCGKRCPKCRQLIGSLEYNTAFVSQEVETRKAVVADALNSKEAFECQSPQSGTRSTRTTRTRTRTRVENQALAARLQREDLSRLVNRDTNMTRRRGDPNQDNNAASARLQRGNDLSRLVRTGRTRGTPSQDEDAALALRLQREEFMEAFRGSSGHEGNEQTRIPLALARANLRAMASRAINRGRAV
ncbi:hypothetical protein CXB51_021886 [Gossypium anomalum]|uniref:RING-type E3 ubiquitin transferase n=1 Tax=Gossypium anomalum TaxID=47600 RepID=A0A8J5YDG2_9ROSI|nr:hypothetical protein CXB51_021886 [Gossypium anomalum]